MKDFIFKFILLFIFGMMGGILATQVIWPYYVERPFFNKYKLDTIPSYVVEEKEITIQENTALKNIIEKINKTIVGIRAIKSGRAIESTGIIVSSDGLIVALSENIPQGAELNIFWENEKITYQVLKRDIKKNLILIKAKDVSWSTAGFAVMDKMELGERVFLLGIIFDKESNPIKIVNQGIIKTFNEDILETNIFENNNISGSPLFDIEGNILGINMFDIHGNIITIPVTEIKEFIGV